jgi:TadE-like protein
MSDSTLKVRRAARKGAEVVEFALIAIPLFAFLFLLIDVAWGVYARSTLQHAVREGVRYAVTSRTADGLGHKASIAKVVADNALGFLSGGDKNKIEVHFYSAVTFEDVCHLPGANKGGNIVEVSVEGFSWLALAPFARSAAPVLMTARASDRMEATPIGGSPPL